SNSLQTLPPGTPINLAGAGTNAVALTASLFQVAAQTAGPVMVTLLLVNAALAILSRAVPQLNAMMVAFPVTIGIGLLMLGAAMPLLGGAIAGWVEQLPAGLTRLLDSLRPVGGGV